LVRGTPRPTPFAGVVETGHSTNNTRLALNADTHQLSCARMSGDKRPSAERRLARAACATSNTLPGGSRTASEKTRSQKSASDKPRKHKLGPAGVCERNTKEGQGAVVERQADAFLVSSPLQFLPLFVSFSSSSLPFMLPPAASRLIACIKYMDYALPCTCPCMITLCTLLGVLSSDVLHLNPCLKRTEMTNHVAATRTRSN